MMQRLRDNLYVLVEFPEDSSYFEENDIGYPSFNSEDTGARYVPQRNYIDHFKKDPEPNNCFRPFRWPESQSYLFPDEPNDQVDTLNASGMDGFAGDKKRFVDKFQAWIE